MQNNGCLRNTNHGFTLIELVAVIVIVGLTAAMGAGFITQTIEQYHKVQNRTVLAMRGAVVMEQLSRQLSQAAPFSLRVSPLGRCIEYVPIARWAYLAEPIPDTSTSNRSLRSALPKVSQVSVWIPNQQASLHYAIQSILIAPQSVSEVYSQGAYPQEASFQDAVGAHARIAQLARSDAGAAMPWRYDVDLAGPYQFLRHDPQQVIWLTAAPERFCVKASQLLHLTGYGGEPLTDLPPANARSSLLADNIFTEEGAANNIALNTAGANSSAYFSVRQHESIDNNAEKHHVNGGIKKPPHASIALRFVQAGEQLLLMRSVFPHIDGQYEGVL